jgi:hypothetical protein
VDAAGRPVLKFGKLLAGRSNQLLVSVRNNGLLPASARIEMDDHPAFSLLEGPQVGSSLVLVEVHAGMQAYVMHASCDFYLGCDGSNSSKAFLVDDGGINLLPF